MKSIVIISGISFILSALLGILSGNLLVTLLLRSLLTSLVVTGGYVLIREIFKKFVPELLEETDPGEVNQEGLSNGSESANPRGKTINIVVDDSDSSEEYSQSKDNESTNENFFEGGNELDEVVEEVQESGISAINSKVELISSKDNEFFEDDGEELSENELPDISGLQSTFVTNESGEEQENSSESDDDYPEETQYSSRSRSSKGGDGQLVADPKILAKAISTALKKGQ